MNSKHNTLGSRQLIRGKINSKYILPVFCLLLGVHDRAAAIEPEHKLGNWIGATSTLRYTDKWSLFPITPDLKNQ